MFMSCKMVKLSKLGPADLAKELENKGYEWLK